MAFEKFGFRSCNKDQIPAAVNGFVFKHGLVGGSDNPTGAVAFDGIADFLACGHANTAYARAVFHRINHDCGLGKGFASVIKAQKILVLV